MVTWTTDPSGKSASITHANGSTESRLLSAIPVSDTILPYSPTAAEIHAELQSSAQIALNKSDITMMRCVEAGVVSPATWNAYRKALRAIVNGTDKTSTVLPSQPPFPSGT